MRPDRCETDTAIAEQDRRYAVPGGRCEDRVPGRLAIIMRMHIDPAGRDQQPVSRDFTSRRPRLAANRADPSTIDRDVSGKRRLPGPVDDRAAANDGVVHGSALASW